MDNKSVSKLDETYLYSRMGMALLSAQRVEFITGQLLETLIEFDREVYRITTREFLETTRKSKKSWKTLGEIFRLLKLNPKWVIENELDDYVKKRNLFVHGFWRNFMYTKSIEQVTRAVNFCDDFGKQSQRLESFFKGFLYFPALRHVKDRDHLDSEFKKWNKDFEYFLNSVIEEKEVLGTKKGL